MLTAGAHTSLRPTLKVKTVVGLSEATKRGENITQGSISGAMISTINLDFTILSQAVMRLQPLIFQDDISRLCSSPKDAQAGNIYV